MKIPWKLLTFSIALLLIFSDIHFCKAQDYIDDNEKGGGGRGRGGGDDEAEAAPPAPPPEQEKCNGIFLGYNFVSREKEYPHVKNVTAQAWAFKSRLTLLNAGKYELKSWKVFIGFHHDEVLVSTDGAVVVDGDGFPVRVGKNGTRLVGFPQSDLKTSIDTAGDETQISVKVDIKGTQFGVKPPRIPMPRKIKLENPGYKCPAPKGKVSYMHVCCTRDPKFKPKIVKTKFFPRQYGDLSFTYDVLQTFPSNYLAQVTIKNNHPLGRLDNWNLTWEWMRNEFIYNMRGAYTHIKDPSECIFGEQGKYYKDFDFSQVMNCQKKPIIADLPPQQANDEKIGKLPYCCRNGSLLPTTMNATKSRSVFQLTVYKLPPDLNRTALNPPQNWNIEGVLNSKYKCGPPIRVDPTEFPDPSGLDAITTAVASWQVSCNITKPKAKQAKCCVSFSAYYAESVVPCNTCACGCDDMDTDNCNPNAHALPLPAEALLYPFANRTSKAKAWAKIKNYKLPKKLPCPDNCGLSINWHVDTDYKTGWTARITLFNWRDYSFEDWFAAIEFKEKAFRGYENVYSFNGTKLANQPNLKNTVFMEGLPGLNYLMGEVNGLKPGKDPRVPGKQQSVISFLKKHTPNIKIAAGEGFPRRVIFNGEECALPSHLPSRNGGNRSSFSFLRAIFLAVATVILFH